MGGISAYILSIIGVVFFGVLIDIIMPEGEMNKYLKGMFGIIALFVIVSPVQKIFNNDFDIENAFYDSTAITVDEDFIQATNKQIKDQMELTIKARLVDAGFSNVNVEIIYDLLTNEFHVTKVIVDISKMVINGNMVHIDKYTEIKRVVLNYLNVEESDVVIDE